MLSGYVAACLPSAVLSHSRRHTAVPPFTFIAPMYAFLFHVALTDRDKWDSARQVGQPPTIKPVHVGTSGQMDPP